MGSCFVVGCELCSEYACRCSCHNFDELGFPNIVCDLSTVNEDLENFKKEFKNV